MTEEFLHYIWKYKLYNSSSLSTHTGERVQILKQGEHNTDSGPDFFNAKIKLGNTVWAGNVEIHIKSSDWLVHKHQNDKAYNNVILHVVYENDKPIQLQNGELIPTFELKNKFPKELYDKYKKLQQSKAWIPCATQIKNVDSFTLTSWMEKLLVERLERKSILVTDALKLNNNNWEQTFYQSMARAFGFKTNSDAFESLAKSLSLNVLSKHKNSLFQIEALLFGQAGLLSKTFNDQYPQYLQNEYSFLKKKYELKSIDGYLWKFMRLRPSNFPTIRISQFAALIHKSTHLFSKIRESKKVDDLKVFFDVDASEYWDSHYTFDKSSATKKKHLGDAAIDSIIINTIVPFLFVYGKSKDEQKYCDKAMDFLEQIAPEDNTIIKNWNKLGVKSTSAYHTQALLQLKNEYCSNVQCLRCAVGYKLLKQ